MARIRVPAGTIQKLEKVFDDLQTYIDSNQSKRLSVIFKETFGFALNVKNGAMLDTDFKCTLNVSSTSPTSFIVNGGQMLTSGNKYVKVDAPFFMQNIPGVDPNSFYLVRIRYAEQGSNLQTAMSSFLYDPETGETTKYTRFNDSYVIDVQQIQESTGWRAGIGTNNSQTSLAIAVVKSNNDSAVALDQSAWTFEDPTDGTLTADSSGVLDLRHTQRMLLDLDLLDDTKVFMKDRNSTAADGGAIEGNIDIKGALEVENNSGIVVKRANESLDSTMSLIGEGSIIVNNPRIQAGTNSPLVTHQTIQLGAPFLGSSAENDMVSTISLRRTNQDSHEISPPSGFSARGIWLKMQGSDRGTAVGNSTSDASTLYFKDGRYSVGVIDGLNQYENMPNIYALKTPSDHVPDWTANNNEGNINHLALNLTRNDRGVIVTKTGNMMIGGTYYGNGTQTLYRFENGGAAVKTVASLYLDQGIAIAAGVPGSRRKGIYWTEETAQSPGRYGPFGVGAITLHKTGDADENYLSAIRLEVNDNTTNVADAETKLELTGHGMLMLGPTSWIEGEADNSIDKLLWGKTKNTKLYVEGNSVFNNSSVYIKDPNVSVMGVSLPNVTDDGSAVVIGPDSVDPTFRVEGLTSLTGDLHVTGNTKLVGNLELPSNLTVTGITTQIFSLENEYRPNSAFIMQARTGPEGGGGLFGLTHALKIGSDDEGTLTLGANRNIFGHEGSPYFSASASGIEMSGLKMENNLSIDIVTDSLVSTTSQSMLGFGQSAKLQGNAEGYASSWLNITANQPAIFLRSARSLAWRTDRSLVGVDDNHTDWVIGTGDYTRQKVLRIGAINSEVDGNITGGIKLNAAGHLCVGLISDTEAKDLDHFLVTDNAVIQGTLTLDDDISMAGKVSFKKDASDIDTPGAGVSDDGCLFVRTDQHAQVNALDPVITAKGRVHAFNDNNDVSSRPQFTLGTTDLQDSTKLMLDADNKFKIMQNNKTLLSTSVTNDGDIVFNNIECTGISGEYIRATTGTSYFGNLQASSLNTAGQIICNGGLTATQHAHFENTVSISGGLTDEELFIGVGTLGIGATKRGLRVLTEKVLPTKPANIRVHDVNPIMDGSNNYPFSAVTLYKNWDKVQGSGANVGGIWQFQVSATTPIDAEASELIGKHFVIQLNEGVFTYKISSWDNTLKRLGLSAIEDVINYQGEGTAGQAYQGQTAVAPNYATIRDLGDKVRVSAVPCDQDGNLVNVPGFEQYVDQSNTIHLGLNLGQHYIVRLACLTDTYCSEFSVMPSGSYDPDNLVGSGQSIVEYQYPFYNELPYLEDDGAITTTSSPFGFTLSIDGWGTGTDPHKTARSFEVGYSTGSVNFENKGNVLGNNTTFFTTENRYQEVNVITQATYNVSVRPIQNGQVVGTPKTAIVTAGGGGAPADYVGYFFGEINVLYHTGTIANASTKTIGGKDNAFVTWSGVEMTKTPFTDTANECALAQNELAAVGGGKGSKIEIINSTGNTSYGKSAITSHSKLDAGGTMSLTAVVGSFDPGYDTAGNKFTIGNSKSNREIGRFTVSTDIVIKMAVIDIEWATGLNSGNPGVIRVYQEGQESQAGTMNVSITEGGLSQVMEVEILGSLGTRTVIIDAFDPDTSSPNNTCSIKGSIELYGQAHIPNQNQQSEL